MNRLWREYAADFDAMTDQQIERERREAQDRIDAEQDFIDAIVSWEAAGRPRTKKEAN